MHSYELAEPYRFRMKEKEYPGSPDEDEVVFQILQTGICGSDLLAYRGLHKYVSLPLVLGHETVGRVLETGTRVFHVKKGDLITVQPQLTCGACYACRHGSPNVCEKKIFMGINIDGFYAEYYKCPGANVIRLPESFTPDMGMLAEPFAVACNAADKAGADTGKNIVVLGAGTIGNCCAQIAAALGATVLITDVIDEKLAYAKKCGIALAENVSGRKLEEIVRSAFPQGVDAIIDCCAVPNQFNSMIESASNASRIVLVGTYESSVDADIIKLQRREIHVYSVMQYTRKHYLKAIEMIDSGKLYLDGFIGARYSLGDVAEAFKYVDGHPGEVMKIALMVSGEEGEK